MTPRLLLLLCAAGCALPQSVRLYSEFERVDPFGKVIAADRAESPREILSPALVRNAHATFVMAVEPPPGQPFSLFIGQNPANAVAVTVYKPVYANRNGTWYPDALEPLAMSETGLLPEVAPQIPGQTTYVYWLDLWVDKRAPVRRTRLEVQMNWDDHWFIYPVELRILAPSVPAAPAFSGTLASVEAVSSETARAVMDGYICTGVAAGSDASEPITVRSLIRRNARQDVLLARSLETTMGRTGLVTELVDAFWRGTPAAWCKSPSPRTEMGAEWYLRIRDYLYRTADRMARALAPGVKTTITVGDKPH